MKALRCSNKLMTASAVALAIVAGACNAGNQNQEGREAATDGQAGARGTAGTSADRNNQPMTLVGCLQQGEGRNDFILTQVNAQPGPVATSGESDSTAVRERQQQAASAAYKLSGGPDNLRDLVGHQVRVTGRVEDRGNVQSGANAQSGDRASTQSGDRASAQSGNREIEEDDLATLEVTSAESVANVCGNAEAGKSGKRERPRQ